MGAQGVYKMRQESPQIREMSLEELFTSARELANLPEMSSLTVHFSLLGCDIERGTLSMSRNPAATRWLTTIGINQGERYYARIAQGESADDALAKIERYCHWWLGI